MAKNTPAASFILSMLGAENSGESVGIFVKSVKVFSLKLERERRVSSGGWRLYLCNKAVCVCSIEAVQCQLSAGWSLLFCPTQQWLEPVRPIQAADLRQWLLCLDSPIPLSQQLFARVCFSPAQPVLWGLIVSQYTSLCLKFSLC